MEPIGVGERRRGAKALRSVVGRLAGLAGYHLRCERLDEADRCLELAEALDPADPRLAPVRARLAILEGNAEAAAKHLERARDFDPFDEDTSALLGELLARAGHHAKAAAAFADAQVLCGAVDPERTAVNAEAMVHELELAKVPAADRTAFMAKRSDRLEELALQAQREATLQVSAQRGESTQPLTGTGPLLAGTRLFGTLTAEELTGLEGVVEQCVIREGEAVFREGQASEDIYVVQRGKIVIQRETPFGTQVLATARRGHLFGEMNFIDGLSRSADAVVVEEADLVRIPHQALRRAFARDRHLALAFLREFWRGLSEKVREGNELMKTFFKEEAAMADAAGGEAERLSAGEGKRTRLPVQAKAGVLDEKGLTHDEIKLLASIAEAETYDLDQVIFHEADPGDALYIVFEGKVRIVKNIPGVGPEALAILDRGDFFGEMALVDGSPRSASAHAHAPGTTVLWIDKSAIEGLLARESESAQDLLSILCRILSARLREINDKIVQWKMMTGGF